jgi:tetratricopeptide (TPR) repeat protein
MRAIVVMLFLLPLVGGCETVKQGFKDISSAFETEEPKPKPRPKPARTGEATLAAGVREFEEGNYTQAQRLLQQSLNEGLPNRTSQARAHKYLAFTYCVTERSAQCRQEFGNALNADPKFALSAAEAGHPTWGPVYRSVAKGR